VRAPSSQPLGLRGLPKVAFEFLLVVAAGVLVIIALLKLHIVVLPVFGALFLTTALYPIHQRLRAAHLPSAVAALLSILLAIALVAGVLALVIPEFVDGAEELGRTAAEGADKLTQQLEDGPIGLDRAELDRLIDRAVDAARGNAGGIGQGVLNGAGVALSVLGGVFLSLVLTFFFLHDGERIWRFLLSFVPRHRREEVHAFGLDVLIVLGGYLRGVLFVATVDAIFIGLGLVVIGVPLVVPLMILTFLAAFIPLAGAFTAGAVAALVALVSGGVLDALLVVAVVTAVQQIEGNLLYPVIMGRSIELHPVVILTCVVAGGVLYGITGAALAVPLTATIWAGIQRFRLQDDPVPDSGVVLMEAPEP
jgi:predicted PurR-regulated permease PerM